MCKLAVFTVFVCAAEIRVTNVRVAVVTRPCVYYLSLVFMEST
jgi:hypothetical protein